MRYAVCFVGVANKRLTPTDWLYKQNASEDASFLSQGTVLPTFSYTFGVMSCQEEIWKIGAELGGPVGIGQSTGWRGASAHAGGLPGVSEGDVGAEADHAEARDDALTEGEGRAVL